MRFYVVPLIAIYNQVMGGVGADFHDCLSPARRASRSEWRTTRRPQILTLFSVPERMSSQILDLLMPISLATSGTEYASRTIPGEPL